MQKGLDYLLNKYSVGSDAVLSECGSTVTVECSAYPVLAWEYERRFVELRALVTGGRVGSPCTYRIAHTGTRGDDILALLKREIGILEFTVNSPVCEIFAIAGKNTLNCIAETEAGCVATIELATTLEAGVEHIDKHEIIADGGVACDRVVDTQVPQQSIYVFGKEKATYRDTDAELFGYSEGEINVIRTAFNLAKSEDYREASAKKNAHLDAVVCAAQKSLDTLENVKVEG